MGDLSPSGTNANQDLMGFITSLLMDALTLTTAAGGLRRFTGISVSRFLLPYIKNDALRGAAHGYFKIGDTIVDTTVDLFTKKGKELKDKDENKKIDKD